MMAIVVFVAESLPTFGNSFMSSTPNQSMYFSGPLLDIIGGSTLSLTSIVFPCLFYLYLAANDKKSDEKGKNEYHHSNLREYVILAPNAPYLFV